MQLRNKKVYTTDKKNKYGKLSKSDSEISPIKNKFLKEETKKRSLSDQDDIELLDVKKVPKWYDHLYYQVHVTSELQKLVDKYDDTSNPEIKNMIRFEMIVWLKEAKIDYGNEWLGLNAFVKAYLLKKKLNLI